MDLKEIIAFLKKLPVEEIIAFLKRLSRKEAALLAPFVLASCYMGEWTLPEQQAREDLIASVQTIKNDPWIMNQAEQQAGGRGTVEFMIAAEAKKLSRFVNSVPPSARLMNFDSSHTWIWDSAKQRMVSWNASVSNVNEMDGTGNVQVNTAKNVVAIDPQRVVNATASRQEIPVWAGMKKPTVQEIVEARYPQMYK